MLEKRSLVLLTICINYISTDYTIYSDGWIPIARDQVYNQVGTQWQHNFKPPTQKPAIDTIGLIEFAPLKQNAEKSVTSERITDLFDHTNQIVTAQMIFQNQIHEDEKSIINAPESQRKAKKFTKDILQNEIAFVDETLIKNNDNGLDENIDYKLPSIDDRSNTYEVTEDTYTSQDVDLSNAEMGIEYDYTPPTTGNQNWSTKLTNILSKYNIKTDDKLQNYDLSRQIKTQNPVNSHKTWNPYRYNSLNHLPVDPLLAVFLSNYGFYLPSLYGIKSNYNNLYGYLASNNIHNNRPFGLYKIFSDTDSWN